MSARRVRLALLVAAVAVAAWLGAGVRIVDANREFAIVLGRLPGLPALIEGGFALAPAGVARLERFPRETVRRALPGASEAMIPAADGTRFGLVGHVTVRFTQERWRALAAACTAAPSGSDPVREAVLAAAPAFARLREARGTLDTATREFQGALRDELAGRGVDLVDTKVDDIDLLKVAPGDRLPVLDRKLLVIGLDGADWAIIDPLLAQGRMPNLESLIGRGIRARLLTMSPMISPVVWTTVATGVEPSRHGILDFLVPAGQARAGEPVTSAQRLAPTVWEILSARGVSVGIVGWWATWPADEVRGYVVTDRVAYQLFGFRADHDRSEGKTWPPELFGELRERIVRPEAITWSRVTPYLDGTRREEGRFSPDERESLEGLRTLLASGETYVALDEILRRRFSPRFEAVYIEGTDTVGHLFMRYRPPRLGTVSLEAFESFHAVVDRYYETVDGYLGRLLAERGDDWTVMVLSDHGFATDDTRPLTTDPRIGHGAAADWHRRFGVFVLAGPDVRRGVRLDEATVYDIAPTILALWGQAVPESWTGRVLGRAIEPAFFDRHPVRLRPDDPSLPSRRNVAALAGDDLEAEELRQKLTNLGYLAQPVRSPAGDALSTANNRGVALIAQGKPEEAANVFREALQVNPGQPMLTVNLGIALRLAGDIAGAEPYLRLAFDHRPTRAVAGHQLAQIEMERGNLPQAERYLRQVLAEEPGSAEAHNGLGLVLDRRGDRSGAESAFLDSARLDAHAAEPRNNLGNLAKARGDLAGAEQWYLKAIEADPYFMGAYNNLALIYQDRGEIGRAIDLYSRALAKAPTNAVVMNNLGSLYFATGDRDEARRLWEQASGADPRYVSPLNNLAGIELTEGRPDEAEVLLRRALEIEPGYGDARINLAIVEWGRGKLDQARKELARAAEDPRSTTTALTQLGSLELETGHPERAATALSAARRASPRSTTVLNALGEALRRLGRRGEAESAWRESLRIDPAQPRIREALDQNR